MATAAILPAGFEALFAHAPDATVVIDSTGVIRLVSDRAEVLFGYPRDELIGRAIEVLVPDRVRSRHPALVATFLAEPAARSVDPVLEPTGRRKEGTEFPAGISIAPVEIDGAVFVAASVRDITSRQRFEGQRGRRKAKIVQAQHDDDQAGLEAQLQQAQRLESVGQLAGGIAHDFNNLLAAIMNYAALASDCLHEQMDGHQLNDDEAFITIAGDVDAITDVAKRAAGLTQQLLTFSRRQVVQPTVFDLNAAVGDLEDLLRRTIGENVDDLQMTLADDLPLIRADRGQIDQVVMNLAVNARDAMPGGGRLDIETVAFDADDDYALKHAIEPGSYVRLSVTDSGSGMSPEVAERAFEPFFTTKPYGEGTGFGLATVYGIVRQTGGDVMIRSEPGCGTTVDVELPASFATPTSPSETPSRPGRSVGGETVLLVEDEAIVREPARRLLARKGYKVLAAESADAALAVMQSHSGSIDLLLTDVIMPGRSGKELAHEVRALSPSTSVLFMSGYSSGVMHDEGVLREDVFLLEKPFTADDLLLKVRAVLDSGA